MTIFTLNARTIQEELNLSEKAADQAMNECPKSTDTDLDIHQQNIVDHVAGQLEDLRHAAQEELNRLDSVRENIERDVEGFSLNHILESAKHKIIRLHAEWHEILDNAKQEEGAVLRNYKYFLYLNKLKREASYPDSAVFHWAFIVPPTHNRTIRISVSFHSSTEDRSSCLRFHIYNSSVQHLPRHFHPLENLIVKHPQTSHFPSGILLGFISTSPCPLDQLRWHPRNRAAIGAR